MSGGTSKLESLLPEERFCGLSQEDNCTPLRVGGVTVAIFDFNKVCEEELGEGILRAEVAGVTHVTAELLEEESLPVIKLVIMLALDGAECPLTDFFSMARGDAGKG